MAEQSPPVPVMRVAVEGCGHGTLHAIYASVDQACQVQGWDGVDVLIIGGDFQAVRNQMDLNVTAMPQKYRKMADFHEYYDGTRTAPYLTIFIGGNHEASNHLFELYYGGWVAPNIYYMGAANVLQLGPLRIAGLSGIWKGYDYHKPHFERLPYNEEDMHSIFHVRELDVRKLLSIRTQVDIGLSHDWPQGIEWLGDYSWLFSKKSFFKEDAESGKLGSVAARQCLDRLRPKHWFSAHLHTKYAAVLNHGPYEPVRRFRASDRPQQQSNQQERTVDAKDIEIAPGTNQSKFSNAKVQITERAAKYSTPSMMFPLVVPPPQVQTTSGSSQPRSHRHKPPQIPNQPQVSAWQTFHVKAQQADAEEHDALLEKLEEQRLDAQRTGVRSRPAYAFNETFKQVKTDENLGREISAVTKSEQVPAEFSGVSNLDDCGLSRSLSLKRRWEATQSESGLKRREEMVSQDPNFNGPQEISDASAASIVEDDQLNGIKNPEISNLSAKNPDAIEIDLSDDEVHHDQSETTKATNRSILTSSSHSKAISADQSVTMKNPDAIDIDLSDEEAEIVKLQSRKAADITPPSSFSSGALLNIDGNGGTSLPRIPTRSGTTMSDESEDGGVKLKPMAAPFLSSVLESVSQSTPQVLNLGNLTQHSGSRVNGQSTRTDTENEISEEMRMQLAALSSNFATPTAAAVSLPLPSAITNTTTKFLALGKCEPFQEFLQLLEIKPVSRFNPDSDRTSRPFKLQYDAEWLAILRAFSSELRLAGNPGERIPQYQGDQYYLQKIIEEEKWVQKHIVQPNRLQVPENFSITAPVYNASFPVGRNHMPREVTNPQTSAFCQLIGIENLFDISETERDERMSAGPRAESGRGGRVGGRGGRNRSSHWSGRGDRRRGERGR